jgi:hypothetical protein
MSLEARSIMRSSNVCETIGAHAQAKLKTIDASERIARVDEGGQRPRRACTSHGLG